MQSSKSKDISSKHTIYTFPMDSILPGKHSKPRKFVIYQGLAFALTALLYSLSHALRTTWGYVKPHLADSNSYYTTSRLGILDLAFTISYAIGQYISGWLGDRVNLKAFLSVGALCAVIGLCSFGYMEGVAQINNIAADIAAFAVNGLGQSTGYPGCISIVSNWFTQGKTGLIFGLWGTNANIGNIIGQQIGKMTVTQDLSWEYALYIASGIMGFFLLNLLIFVKVHPRELKSKDAIQQELLEHPEDEPQLSTNHGGHHGRSGQAIGFFEAWKVKNVPAFAFGIFCIKGVMYGVIFWLPYYLTHEAQLDGDISILLAAIELGMLFGSALLGFLSDRIQSRAIMIAFGFFFSTIFLILTFLIKDVQEKSLYFILLFLSGIGIGGPSSLIGSAVTSDLGKIIAEKTGLSATSTLTGIMEGCGATGAAVSQLIVSNFTGITFPFFAALSFLGGSLTVPVAFQDYRRLKAEHRRETQNTDRYEYDNNQSYRNL